MQKFSNWRENIQNLFQSSAAYFKYLYSLTKFIWRRWLPHLKKFHLNAFPSIRLKGFNRLDLAVKFSPEIAMLAVTSLVALWNIYFFGENKNFTDNSHAAKLILAKEDLNSRLYSKMSVINTVVLSNTSIVNRAQAEEFLSSGINNNYYGEEDMAESLVMKDDAIVQPNPDSVQQLLNRQIKVYETASGDTLRKIAADNGLNVQTIMWANKLTSETIKPGWFLIILPTNGVLHKAGANDTIPDIAKKYASSVDTIIAYNGLENAEDIEPGQIFIIPGGRIPEAPKPNPTPKPSSDGKVKPNGAVIANLSNGTGHIFPKGYCTWYVASKVHVPWGGNAKNWLTNAKAMGYTTTKQAIPGTIVVTTDNARYGHVALVESVNEKGFTVSEMNYEKFGKINTRFIPHASKIIKGFIVP